MMSLQKALPWREGVKTATQGKPEDHDRCSLACGGEFSSLAQPGFFCLKVFPGLGCAQTFKLTLSVVLFLRG